MKTIEEELGEPNGATCFESKPIGVSKWKDNLDSVFGLAVSGWKARIDRTIDNHIYNAFFVGFGDWGYVESTAGTDVSKIAYFLDVIKSDKKIRYPDLKRMTDKFVALQKSEVFIKEGAADPDTGDIYQERIDQIQKAYAGMGDELLAITKDAYRKTLLGKSKAACAAHKAEIKNADKTADSLKVAVSGLLDDVSKDAVLPNRITCFYEPRGLSLSRDFGRGMGFDLLKEGELVPLFFVDKVTLLHLATPSVYLSWIGGEYDCQVRCADHEYAPRTHTVLDGAEDRNTREGVVSLVLGADGKFDKSDMKDVFELLPVVSKEKSSRSAFYDLGL